MLRNTFSMYMNLTERAFVINCNTIFETVQAIKIQCGWCWLDKYLYFEPKYVPAVPFGILTYHRRATKIPANMPLTQLISSNFSLCSLHSSSIS